MATKKVWFVTGASKGLGLALVKRLLAEGYKVAANFT
ncbi:SDR family NAD(P)-dependent oxidoreductase [Siphonobacter sp. BAB-5405]|nr:SDR family NAD(P)-dependent oxidoreductase [Siphonobacter sp. BAB-5405]